MSAANMTTITDSATAPAKKPYARQMTEKRKEQNRRSQKVYREKLKKKLEDLEVQVQKKTQPKQSASPPEVTIQDVVEHVNSSPAGSHTSIKKTNIIDLNAAFAAGGDLCLPTDTTLPTFELGIQTRDESRTPSVSPNTTEFIDADEAAIPKYLAGDVYAPADPDSQDMRWMWPTPASTYWESYTPPTAKQRRIPFNIAFTSVSSTPSLTLSPFSRTRTPSTPHAPTGIPSPYLNHLRLLGESAFSAALAIASSLGITRSAYINDHPSPFSPNILNYASIPRDLRPTREQTTIMHCSYLDCIVFPRFRSAAIVLASRGELDHCSLFLDLMHDGLVCWGNEATGAGRDMRDGVAWSKRSWEARPWFLRKWGWICAIDPYEVGIGLTRGNGVVVDEEEDEMFEGSRWWRSMRGEYLEDEEETGEEHGAMLSRNRTCNIGIRDDDEFAKNGFLWPNQFDDPMSRKLESLGKSATYAMQLG
jgi:Domain of unknown function (DUF3425)